jgi:CheY-like chemotaxis protein
MTPPPGVNPETACPETFYATPLWQCPQEVSHLGRLQKSSKLVEGVREEHGAAESRFGPDPNSTPGKCRWPDTARRYFACMVSGWDGPVSRAEPQGTQGGFSMLVRGLSVLVVDDDELVRDSTRLLLEEAGVRVRTARDGADALDQLAGHTPDLILSDLVMPRMDGYQLVEHVRGDPARAHLPVIAVSALASPADRDRILRAGFDAQIGKPFDYADLAEAFKIAMRRLRALSVRQRDRLRAFAKKQRLKARELRQRRRGRR